MKTGKGDVTKSSSPAIMDCRLCFLACPVVLRVGSLHNIKNKSKALYLYTTRHPPSSPHLVRAFRQPKYIIEGLGVRFSPSPLHIRCIPLDHPYFVTNLPHPSIAHLCTGQLWRTIFQLRIRSTCLGTKMRNLRS